MTDTRALERESVMEDIEDVGVPAGKGESWSEVAERRDFVTVRDDDQVRLEAEPATAGYAVGLIGTLVAAILAVAAVIQLGVGSASVFVLFGMLLADVVVGMRTDPHLRASWIEWRSERGDQT